MILPGGDDHGAADGGGAEAGGPPVGSEPGPGSLFHFDSAGNTCFSTKAEAAATSQLLIDSGFLEGVRSRINSTAFKFVLPQLRHSRAAEAHFCNENVYGDMNLLRVSGLVRLHPAAAEAEAEAAARAAGSASKKPRTAAAAASER